MEGSDRDQVLPPLGTFRRIILVASFVIELILLVLVES
jgi:hypothetical protein